MKKGVGGKITVDGFSFPNEPAYRMYRGLLRLQEIGRVNDLEVNEDVPLLVNEIEVGTVTITFRFFDQMIQQERRIIVASGPHNALRDFKIRCFEAQYGKTIELWG